MNPFPTSPRIAEVRPRTRKLFAQALLLAVACTWPATVRASDPSEEPTKSLPNSRQDTASNPAPGSSRVPQPRFQDNGDGTITDTRTGLMWEKKCRKCEGLHDVEARYYWSGNGKTETVWDWLDLVNGQAAVRKGDETGNGTNRSGLGGHGDWRLANIKELASIVDYSVFEPAVDPIWDTDACIEACADARAPSCSCVEQDLYWTSTTFSDFPAHALTIDFAYGFVDDRVKTNRYHVRAVRGGVVAPRL